MTRLRKDCLLVDDAANAARNRRAIAAKECVRWWEEMERALAATSVSAPLPKIINANEDYPFKVAQPANGGGHRPQDLDEEVEN